MRTHFWGPENSQKVFHIKLRWSFTFLGGENLLDTLYATSALVFACAMGLGGIFTALWMVIRVMWLDSAIVICVLL